MKRRFWLFGHLIDDRTPIRIWHAIVGHDGERGMNGWENFGSGRYCPCGQMVDDENKAIDWLWDRDQRRYVWKRK